jgi:hypothetical protein
VLIKQKGVHARSAKLCFLSCQVFQSATCPRHVISERVHRHVRATMQPPRRASAKATRGALDYSLLLDLPDDIKLRCCEWVHDHHDQAALCLAVPPLGLAALRQLPIYKGPLLSVAMTLRQRSAASLLDERLLRRYAAHSDASADGCAWLAAAAQREQWPLHISLITTEPTHATPKLVHWHLMDGECEGAVLRSTGPDRVAYFSGERKGHERLERLVYASGMVEQFEGARGAERLVRVAGARCAPGHGLYFEGTKGVERMVRAVFPSGDGGACKLGHFEGERGAERTVRLVFPSGEVQYYEGAKGEEKKVRSVHRSGAVVHFEGVRGAERVVRRVLSCGNVLHCEGAKGAERVVRLVLLSGVVRHCVGAKGEEQLVYIS